MIANIASILSFIALSNLQLTSAQEGRLLPSNSVGSPEFFKNVQLHDILQDPKLKAFPAIKPLLEFHAMVSQIVNEDAFQQKTDDFLDHSGIKDFYNAVTKDFSEESWGKFETKVDQNGLCRKECTNLHNFMGICAMKTIEANGRSFQDTYRSYVASHRGDRQNQTHALETVGKEYIDLLDDSVGTVQKCSCDDKGLEVWPSCYSCLRGNIEGNTLPEFDGFKRVCKQSKDLKDFATKYNILHNENQPKVSQEEKEEKKNGALSVAVGAGVGVVASAIGVALFTFL